MSFIYNAPSVLERREACPGSGALEAECPRGPQTDKMLRGINMHKWAQEAIMTGKLNAALVEEYDKQTVRLAEEHVFDLVRKHAPELGKAYRDCGELYRDGRLRCEQQIQLGHIGYKGKAFIDVVIDLDDLILVIELKMGEFEVSGPLANRQLHCYFSGIARAKVNAKHFVGAVIQPALVEEAQVRDWIVDRDKIAEVDAQLAAIVKATLNPSAKLEWGDHCSFCNAKEMCPARRGTLDDAIKAVKANPNVATYLDNLDGPGRSLALREAKQAAGYLKKFIELVVAWKLNNLDKDLPGFKVGHGRGSRAFQPGEETRAKLWEMVGPKLIDAGLTREQLAETISPTKIEEHISKAEAALIGGLVVKEPGALTVVEDKAPSLPKPRKD